jgi:hypothetical protein
MVTYVPRSTRVMQTRSTPKTADGLRVLYVVGAARSGSTILNTLLGSHPEIFAAGELGYLSRSGDTFRETCSCGAPATHCVFWSQVYDRWIRLGGPPSIDEYVALQGRFERGRFWPKQRIPKEPDESVIVRTYLTFAFNLLRAVQEVSGKTVLVDATKTPWRAIMLARLPGIDLRLVHLVRHPAGVVWSMKKGFMKDARGRTTHQATQSAWRSSLYWIVMNLQAAWVRHRLPANRSVRIRYEDLAQEPGDTLRQIGQLIDCDLEGIGQRASFGGSFNSQHTIAGNRVRMEGSVRLKLDRDWESQISRCDRMICQALTGPLAKYYGYENRLSSPSRSARADSIRDS